MLAIDVLLFVVAVVLLLATFVFGCRLVRVRDRFVSVATCMYEASVLAEARARTRERRRRVHDAVDTGTVGLEIAHRVVARHFGGSQTDAGGRVYEVARDVNQGVDSILSAWFAPRHSEGHSPSHKRDGD